MDKVGFFFHFIQICFDKNSFNLNFIFFYLNKTSFRLCYTDKIRFWKTLDGIWIRLVFSILFSFIQIFWHNLILFRFYPNFVRIELGWNLDIRTWTGLQIWIWCFSIRIYLPWYSSQHFEQPRIFSSSWFYPSSCQPLSG